MGHIFPKEKRLIFRKRGINLSKFKEMGLNRRYRMKSKVTKKSWGNLILVVAVVLFLGWFVQNSYGVSVTIDGQTYIGTPGELEDMGLYYNPSTGWESPSDNAEDIIEDTTPTEESDSSPTEDAESDSSSPQPFIYEQPWNDPNWADNGWSKRELGQGLVIWENEDGTVIQQLGNNYTYLRINDDGSRDYMGYQGEARVRASSYGFENENDTIYVNPVTGERVRREREFYSSETVATENDGALTIRKQDGVKFISDISSDGEYVLKNQYYYTRVTKNGEDTDGTKYINYSDENRYDFNQWLKWKNDPEHNPAPQQIGRTINGTIITTDGSEQTVVNYNDFRWDITDNKKVYGGQIITETRLADETGTYQPITRVIEDYNGYITDLNGSALDGTYINVQNQAWRLSGGENQWIEVSTEHRWAYIDDNGVTHTIVGTWDEESGSYTNLTDSYTDENGNSIISQWGPNMTNRRDYTTQVNDDGSTTTTITDRDGNKLASLQINTGEDGSTTVVFQAEGKSYTFNIRRSWNSLGNEWNYVITMKDENGNTAIGSEEELKLYNTFKDYLTVLGILPKGVSVTDVQLAPWW